MDQFPNKKKKEEQEEGLPIWMATFADMMTLLFAFFVLLFSMATIDPVKVSAMQDSMAEHSSGGGEGEGDGPPKMKSMAKIKEALEQLKAKIATTKKAIKVSETAKKVKKAKGE